MTNVISLSPTMQKRLNFEHPLTDRARELEVPLEQCTEDNFVTGNIWLVKDLVMRFRAHWPDSRRFTDELVSVGLEVLCERAKCPPDRPTLEAAIHGKMREHLNNFRAIIRAGKTTNQTREAEGKPTEYHFAKRLKEELVGIRDDGIDWVEFFDLARSANGPNTLFRTLENEYGVQLTKSDKSIIKKLLENFRAGVA